MSAVCSSAAARKTPKLAGGWASRSTSALRVMICSRASRSVAASRSLLAAVRPGVGAGIGQPALEHGQIVRMRGNSVT